MLLITVFYNFFLERYKPNKIVYYKDERKWYYIVDSLLGGYKEYR